MLINLIGKIVMPAVVIRQRKPWRRRDGIYLYFEGMLFFFRTVFVSLPQPRKEIDEKHPTKNKQTTLVSSSTPRVK